MKNLFDTHCHLYDERYSENKEAFFKELQDSDLKYVVDIGTDLLTCRKVLEDVAAVDMAYGAVGYYPGDTGMCPAQVNDPDKQGLSSNGAPILSEDVLEEVFNMYLNNPKIVAIGEIGLDYHDPDWYALPKTQRYWFNRQLEEAVRLDAPVCIHSRDADGETFEILKEKALGKIPVLLHCYSGSAQLAREYVKRGATISLGGPLTFKNARHSVEVAQIIDLKDLVVETDAPYLTPVPFRGKTNKPYYVKHVAEKIAEIKGLSYEEVASATFENACRFYRVGKC